MILKKVKGPYRRLGGPQCEVTLVLMVWEVENPHPTAITIEPQTYTSFLLFWPCFGRLGVWGGGVALGATNDSRNLSRTIRPRHLIQLIMTNPAWPEVNSKHGNCRTSAELCHVGCILLTVGLKDAEYHISPRCRITRRTRKGAMILTTNQTMNLYLYHIYINIYIPFNMDSQKGAIILTTTHMVPVTSTGVTLPREHFELATLSLGANTRRGRRPWFPLRGPLKGI